MTDEQIESIARRHYAKRGWPQSSDIQDAIREALAQLRAAPCPTEATPAALLVESDRLEESGWPEQAALMRDAAGKWEQYKELHQRALEHVDAVFQPGAQEFESLLPDFCRAGDDKFEAVVWLAIELIALGGQNVRRRNTEAYRAILNMRRRRAVTPSGALDVQIGLADTQATERGR